MSSSFRTELRRANDARETTIVLLPETPPWWVASLVGYGALVLQSSVAPLVALRGGTLGVAALVTLWYAVRSAPPIAVLFGALVGAGEDALGTTGAAYTLANGASALVVSLVRTRVPLDRPALVAPILVAALLARGLAAYVVLAFEGRPLAMLATTVHGVLWQALLTGAVGTALVVVAPRLGGARGRY